MILVIYSVYVVISSLEPDRVFVDGNKSRNIFVGIVGCYVFV